MTEEKVKKPRKKKYEPTEAELANPRTPEQFRLALRRKMRAYYDLQEMRLQAQGRITKKALDGQIELHPADKSMLLGRFQELETVENAFLKVLETELNQVPFYRDVIRKNKKYIGLGPRMGSVIIASFDIHRQETPSQMFAFAGIAPIPARRCSKCQIVVKEISGELTSWEHTKPSGNKCELAGTIVTEDTTFASGKAMRPVAGEKLKYNSWLRAKLCGVLGEVLIKLKSPYRKFYDDYKHRKECAGWGVSPMHRHKAAVRYMIKMMLLDIWKEWRTFENLPVRPSYAEQFLGKVHHGRPTVEDDFGDVSPEDLIAEQLENQSLSDLAEPGSLLN